MDGDFSGFPFGHPIQSGFWVALVIVAVMVLGGLLTLMGQWTLRQLAQLADLSSSQRRGIGDRPTPPSPTQTVLADDAFPDAENGNSSRGNSWGSTHSNTDDHDNHRSSRNSRDSGDNGDSRGRAIARTTPSPNGLHRRSPQQLDAPQTINPSSTHPRLHEETSSRNGISDSGKLTDIFLNFVNKHRVLLIVAFVLLGVDLIVLTIPRTTARLIVEVPLSLGAAIALAWLSSRLFRDIFDIYLLDTALREGRKLNSEFLILGKIAANGAIILLVVSVFAQTHNINIFGLVASLGIGGLAVAFAAQKTLEQLLGGVVLYLDRPFMVDDYIGLPDGTFGRVESIGLRSTKVRLSGKGTIMIVPNSALTQMNIENFTGAKKVMAILYLDLYQLVSDDEMALIRQVILESTSDIFGIDARSTDVTFRLMPGNAKRTQVQVTFFILGSGEVSMELRRQVLDLASQNITQRLTDYGLRFDIDEPTIYVDAPITI